MYFIDLKTCDFASLLKSKNLLMDDDDCVLNQGTVGH